MNFNFKIVLFICKIEIYWLSLIGLNFIDNINNFMKNIIFFKCMLDKNYYVNYYMWWLSFIMMR